jgi:hypothetical protein
VQSSALGEIYCLWGFPVVNILAFQILHGGKVLQSYSIFFRGNFNCQMHHRVIGIVCMAYFLAIDCFFFNSPSISWNPTACSFYFPYYWYKYWVNPILSLVYFFVRTVLFEYNSVCFMELLLRNLVHLGFQFFLH